MQRRLAGFLIVLLSLAGLGAWSGDATSAPRFARTSGNWSTNGNWSNASCLAAGATTAPTGADDVTICNNVSITVDGAAKSALSVNLQTGANATSLILATNLTVGNGGVTMNTSTGAVTRQIVVGANTLTVTGTGNITINGGTTAANATNISELTATSGDITISGTGNLLINAGAVQSIARVTVDTGHITVGGSTTLTGGGAANRVALLSVTGASAVGKGIDIAGTLTLSGSAVGGSATVSMTSTGRINVAGVGGVANGDTISIGAGAFTLTGAAAPFVTTNAAAVTSTTATTGTLSIPGNATVTGGTANPSGATMSLTTGIITVGGTLNITAGSNTNTSATVSVTTGRITATGNTTLTGGAAAGRNALLTVSGAPAVAGNGINIGGTLTVASNGTTPTATTATVSVTGGVAGVINVTGAGGVVNNDTISVATGIFTVTNGFSTTNNAVVSSTTVTSGTLAIGGNASVTGGTTNNATATMSLTTGVITVGGTLNVTAGAAAVTNPDATVSVTTGRISVTGNTTLTGGTSGARNALLTVSGTSAVGDGINIGGTLNVVSTASGSSTVSITGAGGRITVAGAGGVTNGDQVTVGAGIFTVTNAFATTSNTIVTTTSVTTGSLTIGGNVTVTGGTAATTGATMTVGAGTITIGTVGTPRNLTLTAGGANPSIATVSVTGAGLLDVSGNVTVNGSNTAGVNRNGLLLVSGVGAAGQGVNIGGNLVTTSTAAATATAQMSGALALPNASRITVAGTVTNGDQILADTGIFTANGTTFTTTSATNVSLTRVTTGTLAIAGDVTVTGGTTNPSGATMSATTGIITVGGSLGITAGSNTNTSATVSVTTGRITVTGDTTVTGGAATGRNALLTVTAAPATGGNGINLNGDLTLVSSVTTTATASTAAAGAVFNVAGDVTNRDQILINTGIFNATGAAKTFVQNNNAIVTATTVTSGTLAIAGNATVTGGTANPSGATMSLTTGILTVGGNLGITAGTNTSSNATVSVTTGRITVTGNATLTGSAAAGVNRNALLTVTAAPAVAGNGININGDLTVASHAVTPTATTATVSTTIVNAVVNVAGNVTNNDQILVNAGTFNATGAAKTFAQSNNAIVTATTVTTGTLAIAGNATVTGGTANPSGATMSLTTGILTVGGNLGITAGTNSNSNATVSVTTGRITVTGNATLTGSAAAGVNRNALLTVTGAPAAGGNGININGNLTVAAHATPTATTATVSIGIAAGVINVAGNVTNRDTVLADAGVFTVTGASSTYDNNNATIVANTRVSTGSLNISGSTATLNNASGDTMSITSTGIITVGNSGTNTGVLTNSGTITLTVGGTVHANGNFTNSGTFTNSAAGLLFLGGATSIVNGTFTAGTGTVTMDGSAAQNLSGSALSLRNFTVNNTAALATRTVTLGNDLTVSNQLTFTSGRIVTGSSKVVLPSGALAVIGATGSPNERFVAGNLQKFVAAGAPTVTFEIGSDGTAAPLLGYSPVTLVFAGVTASGGSMIASVGLPVAEHPSIAGSGINDGNEVNRWWSLTTTGVTGTALPAFTSYSATATFLNPSDLDVPASTGNYDIERWDGTVWNTTNTTTRGATSTQATGITALGELAIGVKALPVATGDLNAFESTTAANAVTGRVFTKLVGVNFSLDVVAIQSGVQLTTFNKAVQVDLVTGASGGLNCGGGTPTTVPGSTQSVTLASGRGTTGAFNVSSAIANVRVRMRFPAGSPVTISCSTDNFSIRPTGFAVSSVAAANTDSSGSSPTPIKAGANFDLVATAVAGYTGIPTVVTAQVVGSPNAGTLAGSFNAATGGVASGSAFTYTEVGNFGLNANAVVDTSFTLVDQAGGDCVASSFSNTLVGGKYGCSIGSPAIPLNVAPSGSGGTGFGRFIPHNFNVSYGPAPQFVTGCGAFSYVGRKFAYDTGAAPLITVTARNSGGNPTTNYAGAYAKLTNSSLPGTQASRYSRFDAGSTPALDVSGLPSETVDPVIGTFASGVGTLTFSSGTGGLGFIRDTTTPSAPFNADIALSINVVDADGVAYGANPAAFGVATLNNGIAFTSGKAMRYGRLRMHNALGSEKLDLPIRIETEYWTGTGFSTNTLDGCTTLSVTNFSFPAYAGGVTSTNMNSANISPAVTIPFTAGVGSLKLTKPLSATPGSATLKVDLTSEAKTYLQGNWGQSAYTADPSARAAFGVYAAQPRNFIFFRENY